MNQPSAAESKIYRGLGVACFAFLAGYVLVQTRAPFFDEVWHLAEAARFSTADSLHSWLVGQHSSAAGPLYGFLYHGFERNGAWPVPLIRVPNLILLAVTLTLLTAICRRQGAAAAALGLMAVPMIWVTAGMALTEMPALALLTIAFYAAERLGNPTLSDPAPQRLGLILLLAAAFGLAVSARQTSLVVAPPLLVFAVRRPMDLIPLLIAIGLGLAPMLAVFREWGGLVPPGQARVAHGLSFAHAGHGLAYVAASSLLLAPRWWWRERRWVASALAAAIVIYLVVGGEPMTTLSSAQRWLGHPALARALERSLAALGLAAGVAFAVLLARAVWQRRDRVTLGAVLGIAAVVASCAMVTHQFSSRYVTLALPFIVVLAQRDMDFGRWAWARLVGGAAIGFVALHSYYVFSA